MCGCLSNKKEVAEGLESSSQVNDIVTPLDSNEGVCEHKREELNTLDGIIIDIYKNHVKDPLLLESNRMIRKWVKNLENECPNYYELNTIREYVENEYAEYIT